MMKKVPELKTLFWEATSNCNAYCQFCGSRCGQRYVPDLPGDVIIRTFKEIATAYDASKIMIDVTGGEPLLRKDLFSVMKTAVNLGFSWGMVTNGSLITGEVIEKMKKSGIKTISISVDGLFEAHNSSRRLPGSFHAICKSIMVLAEQQFLDHIQITTVITKKNVHFLPEMYEFFSGLPIDSWRLAPVDYIGRCREHSEILLDKEEFISFIDFMKSHQFSGKLRILTSCSHYLGIYDSLFRQAPFCCNAGKSVASILSDGTVYVCPNVPRRKELFQGNIQKDHFIECWEKGFSYFRNSENRKRGRCAECSEWNECQGDSLHTWDFDNQQPSFCIQDYYDVHSIRNSRSEEIRRILRQEYPGMQGLRISYGSSSDQCVIFTPSAAEELYWQFHWGKYHPSNICEQISAAVGYREKSITFVVGLISLPLQNRSEDQAVFSPDLHQYALYELNVWNQSILNNSQLLSAEHTPYVLLGYIHSHPGNLKIVMSQPDIQLHERMRKQLSENYFTGIINPHSKDLGIYLDSVFCPNDVILLMTPKDIEKWK